METDKVENHNATTEGLSHDGVAIIGILKEKLNSLNDSLHLIDADISNLNKEHDTKMHELQKQKKSVEESIYHVSEILRLEGHETVDSRVESNKITETYEKNITNAAFTILEKIHIPMHYKDLARKLQEDQIFIPGKDPAATLLSRMTRDSRFKRGTKRGEYALLGWRLRKVKRKISGKPKTKA